MVHDKPYASGGAVRKIGSSCENRYEWSVKPDAFSILTDDSMYGAMGLGTNCLITFLAVRTPLCTVHMKLGPGATH